ncbi:energy-coupling factor ABC transporter permease [Neisseria sp. Ec49-e6-T10]|uniref:energy-coupling factor ABC transporter permease n=1 Tax=Neisseria sp. Ec49-e6-T10 TaxID=3140744 RepID=UPI003EBF40F1
MNLPEHLFPDVVLYTAWFIMLCILGLTLKKIIQNKQLFSGSGCALFCILMAWMLHASVNIGLNYHFLGVTLLTLTLGWSLTLWIMALACIIYTLVFLTPADLLSVGLNFCIMTLPAVSITLISLKAAQKYLPKHIFIFILGNGFITAALSLLACALLIVLTLGLFNVYPMKFLISTALPVYFFIAWGEAFLTGLITAVLVCFAPQWVTTFDDDLYLKKPTIL